MISGLFLQTLWTAILASSTLLDWKYLVSGNEDCFLSQETLQIFDALDSNHDEESEGLTMCRMAALTLKNEDSSEMFRAFCSIHVLLLWSHGAGDPLLWLFGRDGPALKSSIIACSGSPVYIFPAEKFYQLIMTHSNSERFSFPWSLRSIPVFRSMIIFFRPSDYG